MRKSRASLIVNALCAAAIGVIAVTLWQRAKRNEGSADAFVITCHVWNPDGTPAAGVPVSSFSAPSRHLIAKVTDRDGVCEFPDASQLSVTFSGDQSGVSLIARAPSGCAVEFVDWRRRLPLHHADVDLHLKRPDTVTLHVVDSQGRPQAHVRTDVATFTNGRRTYMVSNVLADAFGWTTDDGGTVTLPNLWNADKLAITIDDDRFAPLRADIVLGGPQRDRRIILEPSCHIQGRVAFAPGGRPTAGVLVEAALTSGSTSQISGVVTDDDGRFTLTHLRPARYSIQVSNIGSGWAAEVSAVSLTKIGETSHVTIPLVRKSVLIVHVHTESGEPISRACIAVQRTAPTCQSLYFTDRNGECRIDTLPGPQTVSLARLPSGCRAVAPATRAIDARAGETVTLDYAASGHPADDLSGIVLDAEGNRVPNAVICIGPISFYASGHRRIRGEWGRFDPGARWLTRGRVAMPEVARTDGSGRFTVSSEWQGVPCLIWAAQGATAATPAPLRIALHKSFALTLRDRVLGGITGTIVDESGKPVAGASVTLDRCYTDGPPLASPPLAISDSRGVFEIDSLPVNVPYMLQTADSRHGCARGSDPITLSPGEVRRLAPVALPATKSFIAGEVLDSRGFPVAGAQVTATGSVTGTRSAVSDAQGRYRVEWIANEPMHVRATTVPPHIEFTRPVIVPYTGLAAGSASGMGDELEGSPPAKSTAPEPPQDVTAAAGDSNVMVRIRPD